MTSPAVRTGNTPVGTGVLLGTLNVLVIALGLSVAAHEDLHCDLGIGMFVFVIGLVPGVLAGAVLGKLAEVTKMWPRWSRLLVLVVPAVGVVALVAAPFYLQEYVPVACIPTLVATLILERATRYKELPVIPAARARE